MESQSREQGAAFSFQVDIVPPDDCRRKSADHSMCVIQTDPLRSLSVSCLGPLVPTYEMQPQTPMAYGVSTSRCPQREPVTRIRLESSNGEAATVQIQSDTYSFSEAILGTACDLPPEGHGKDQSHTTPNTGRVPRDQCSELPLALICSSRLKDSAINPTD
jgi:hypothetical protein